MTTFLRRILCSFVAVATVVLAACSSGEDAPDAAVEADNADPTALPADGPAATPTPDPYADWDAELRELVAFIETERDDQFRTITDVEYVGASAVAEQLASQVPDVSTLPPDSLLTLEHLDGMYRALGLVQTDFDFLTARAALSQEVVAFYDPGRATIVFGSSRDAADTGPLAVEERVIAVHELAHALQRQARLSRVAALGEPTLIGALIEGEAEWMMERYVDNLSAEERRNWFEFRTQRRQPIDGSPEIMIADFALPYQLGLAFFDARFASDGLAGVDAAFDAPGLSARSILDPWSFAEDRGDVASSHGDVPIPAGVPAVRLGGEFPFTALRWYPVFATTLPTDQALLAAREVVDFRFPAGWLDGDDRLCFAVEAPTTEDGTSTVGAALDAWVAADSDHRSVQAVESGFLVEGCDPGTDGPTPVVAPLQALARAALIIEAETWAVEQSLVPEVGFCIGLAHLDTLDRDLEYGASEWLADLEPEDAPADCL